MRLCDGPGLPAYYLAATLARLGDEMVGFTLVLLVLARTGNPWLAGGIGAAYAFPAIVTGPLLGAWLDRTAHRRLALATNQAVLAVVMLAMLALVGRAPDVLVLAMAVVAGLTLPMVAGGFTSMLPAIVPPPLLTRANAAEAASFGTAAMAGPAAAATVAALVSPEAAVLLVVIAAVGSLVALVGVPPVRPDRDTTHPPMLAAALDGLRHLFRGRPLRAVTVASTLSLGASGMLLVTLPLHAVALGAPAATSGYVWTALEIGSVAAALLVGRWQDRWRPERTVLLFVAAYGAAMLTWPLAGSIGVLVGLALLAGLLNGPMMPAMFGARQVYSPLALQGRVSTSAAGLRMATHAIGQAVGGSLAIAVPTGAMLTIVACCQISAAALGTLALGGRHKVSAA